MVGDNFDWPINYMATQYIAGAAGVFKDASVANLATWQCLQILDSVDLNSSLVLYEEGPTADIVTVLLCHFF
jgi:hypothetical protein